ncbi:SAM-dependent methyltransferase [Kitasatospora sp. MAA19]|uniref:class I SAM-dependent methyltransferase n=1 Tax=unclassified Kitasatospora TaxID=2633591 RepID=UPI0024770869|nr:class I SAM-dependent methyltransferase [Kitasatospora sp. MAA19]MDH6707216.1 SAM-dependent methyltransferase [Kitasatospora sp. MAA19]
MSFSTRHLDRARAESFGATAEDYDRYRPEYPVDLVDDLVHLRATDVLDVGCGTGKASAALAARGLSVSGIEPDDRMAHVARRRGLPVETTTFEAWHPGGRRFDLIISADAWHWVNPAQGARKAAQILAPGGHIARFWSFHVLDDPILEELDGVYRKHAPGVQVGGARQKSTAGVRDPLADGEDFVAVAQRDYRWSLALNADEWIGLISTFSDHHRMAPTDRSALFDRVREVIESRGGTVRTTSGTFLQLARRV